MKKKTESLMSSERPSLSDRAIVIKDKVFVLEDDSVFDRLQLGLADSREFAEALREFADGLDTSSSLRRVKNRCLGDVSLFVRLQEHLEIFLCTAKENDKLLASLEKYIVTASKASAVVESCLGADGQGVYVVEKYLYAKAKILERFLKSLSSAKCRQIVQNEYNRSKGDSNDPIGSLDSSGSLLSAYTELAGQILENTPTTRRKMIELPQIRRKNLLNDDNAADFLIELEQLAYNKIWNVNLSHQTKKPLKMWKCEGKKTFENKLMQTEDSVELLKNNMTQFNDSTSSKTHKKTSKLIEVEDSVELKMRKDKQIVNSGNLVPRA